MYYYFIYLNNSRTHTVLELTEELVSNSAHGAVRLYVVRNYPVKKTPFVTCCIIGNFIDVVIHHKTVDKIYGIRDDCV